MPRKKLPPTNQFPYHITARCINRDWFGAPLEEVWSIMSNQLHFAHHAFDLRVHAFVLMPNHYHLLASTPRANISPTMEYFGRETSRSITRSTGRINQTYGGPFHKTIVGSYLYYMHAYKYVLRNPVEARLCTRVEDYRFSTLPGLLGLDKLIIPVCEDTLLFEDPEHNLKWLNTSYKGDHKKQIQMAMRGPEFKFAKMPDSGLWTPLERELS